MGAKEPMEPHEFIDFQCPYCRQPLSFPQGDSGVLRDCPFCSRSIVVPGEADQLAAGLKLPFSTERLLLRRLESIDREDLLELMADAETFRFLEWAPMNAEEVEDWIKTGENASLATPGGQMPLAVSMVSSVKTIGFVNLYSSASVPRQGGFTILIHPQVRKQGLGTEAIRGVLRFAFESLQWRRVAVGFDSRNAAAARMLEKAGMRCEGEFMKDAFLKGEWVNTLWFAMLAEEFVEATPG